MVFEFDQIRNLWGGGSLFLALVLSAKPAVVKLAIEEKVEDCLGNGPVD